MLSLSGSSDPSAGRLQSEGVRDGSRRQKEREVGSEVSDADGVRAKSHVVTSTCLLPLLLGQKRRASRGRSSVTFSGSNYGGERTSYLNSLWCCGRLSRDDLKALWRLTHH